MKLIALNDVKIVHERHQEFSLCITSKPLSPSTLSGDERAALSERAKDTHPLTTAIINDIQHETDSSLSSSPLSFERCDVSLFDTTVVRGFPGLTDVTVRLFHHRREVLCQASVVVLCCEEDHPDIASSESAKSHLLTTFLTTSMSLLTSLPTPHRRHAPILSPPPPLPTDSTVVLEVVVGVKSFALNAEKRQSIRQNLQRRAQQYGDVVRLSFFFLVGWSPFVAEDPRVQHLLAEEKEVHGDVLLEEELPVEDNYLTLTDKVMTFLAWLEGGSDTRAKADFVVISDDDTYVSVPSLLTLLLEEKDKMRQAPRQYHWYAGEVLEDRLAHKFKPMRDPAHRNYLPAHLYPFTELPPFALGNFYILSSSLVHYFASQQHVLRSVGSLEDVSVGFWLQSLGVRAEDLRGVFHLTRWYHAFTFFSSLSPEDAWENPRLHLLAVSGLSRALSFQQLFEAEELSLDHYLIRAAAIGAIHHPSNTSLSLFDAMQRQYTMYREILSSLSQESSGESKGVRVDRLKNPHYLHDNQALTSLYRSLFTSQQPLRVVVVLASHCLKEVQYEGVQASQHLREHLLHLLQGESEVEVEVEVVVGGMLMSSEWFNFVQRQHIAVRFLSGLQNLSETNEHLLHLLSPSLSHYLSPISSEVSRGSLLHLRYLLSFDVVLVPLFPASSSSVEVREVTQLVRMISFLQIYDRLHGNPTEDDIDDISSSLIIPLLLGGGEGVEEVCFEGVDRWFDRIFESLDSRELVYFLQLLSLPTSSNTSATASLHSLLLPQTLPLHCLPAQHNATTYYYEKLQRHNQDMTSSMDTSSREIRRRRRELSRVTLPRSFEQSPFTQRVEESALQQITVRTQRTVVVVGSDVSLYALSFLLSSLHHLLPSLIVDEVWVLISRQSPHFARMLRLRGFDQWIVDDDDADPVIAPLREVLQQRRSEGVSVLLLSTFLDCAVVAPRHTNKTPADSPSHTMRWEEGSDECFLSIKSVTSPDVTVWMHGEPNPLPRLLLERVEEVADVVFVCHSEHSLAYSLPPPRSTSHTTTYSTTSNTTSAFVSYLPTFATSFFEPSDEAEDEGSASTWQHHPLQLLDPVTTSTMEEEQWEWRVAYLYFNCDRRDRETFFSQLTSLLHNRSFSLPSSDREVRVTVEALGRCRGHGLEGMCEEEGRQYVRSRFSVNSSREAVAMYRGGGRGDGGSGRGFDYVIAMENDYVRDYVSEKLTNALLTQAIPIYIGAPNIHDYFHSSAFLSCSALSERPRTSDWVERCAEEVAQLILSRIRSGGRDVKRRQVWQGRTWRERFESFLSLFFFHPVTATASPYTRQWQRLFKNKLQRLYVSE